MTEHSGITSVNNFTLAMRLNLAHSIGLGAEEILPNWEDLSMRGTSGGARAPKLGGHLCGTKHF